MLTPLQPWSKSHGHGLTPSPGLVGILRLPPRPPAREDGQSLKSFYNSPRRLLKAAPLSPMQDDYDSSLSPRRRLRAQAPQDDYDSPLSPRRRLRAQAPQDDYDSSLSPRRRSQTQAQTQKSKTKMRLVGGLDGDARNLHFLQEMLGVVGGQELMLSEKSNATSIRNQQQLPVTLTGGIPDILSTGQNNSPRTSKVYSREETLLLQQTLGNLVQRSRNAVAKMNQALHLQATNRTPHKNHHVPPRSARKRVLTVGSGRRHHRTSSNNSSNTSNTNTSSVVDRSNSLEPNPSSNSIQQRPGSAASLSILDTALSVAREGKAWDLVTCEIVRQVHSTCRERGALLNFVRLRYKQTTELLVALCQTQQQMLESFSHRQEHMRPRTRTVEKMYRKKKREQEVNTFTNAIKDHQQKLDLARARIQRLSNQLVCGGAAAAESSMLSSTSSTTTSSSSSTTTVAVVDEFELAMRERAQTKAYELSKQQFKLLLSDLSRMERESNRFRQMVHSDDAAGCAAREAMETHRNYVQTKIKNKEELLKTTIIVQAHWRGYRARNNEVVQAKLAYQQRMIQEEAERKERAIEAGRLFVARWLQRQYTRWDMKCRLDGLLANDRERRRKAAQKHRRKHHVHKRHTWFEYLSAAKTIQANYRLHLMSKHTWRAAWLHKIKKEAEEKLLKQISDEGQREQTRRTITLSLQEQESTFFSQLREYRDQIEYLERKLRQTELVDREHFKTATKNVEEARKEAKKVIQDNENACQKLVREKELQIHYLTHTLEGTKVKHTNNAKKK